MAKKKAPSTTRVGKTNSTTSTVKSQPAQKQEQDYQSALRGIRQRFAQLNRADVLGRHAIGQDILKFKKDPKKYGERLVERLAGDLKKDASTLYEYARVAEAWTTDELEAKLENSQADSGEPLTWSHFAAAAQMNVKRSRNQLIKEARVEGLSVRQLKARRAERSTSESGELAEAAGGTETRSDDGAAQETASSDGSDSEKIRQLGVRNAKGAVEGTISQLKRFQQLHKHDPDKKDNGGGQLSQDQKQQLRDLDAVLAEAEKYVKSTRACIGGLLKQSTKSGA